MPITERHILMCDDFRREDNGKFILVGLYTPDMMVLQLPLILPTLTFFCMLDSDQTGIFSMNFLLRHEEGNRTLAQGGAQVRVIDIAQPIILPIKMGPIQILETGAYTFSLEFANQAPVVKAFAIRRGAPPSLPQRPL